MKMSLTWIDLYMLVLASTYALAQDGTESSSYEDAREAASAVAEASATTWQPLHTIRLDIDLKDVGGTLRLETCREHVLALRAILEGVRPTCWLAPSLTECKRRVEHLEELDAILCDCLALIDPL